MAYLSGTGVNVFFVQECRVQRKHASLTAFLSRALEARILNTAGL